MNERGRKPPFNNVVEMRNRFHSTGTGKLQSAVGGWAIKRRQDIIISIYNIFCTPHGLSGSSCSLSAGRRSNVSGEGEGGHKEEEYEVKRDQYAVKSNIVAVIVEVVAGTERSGCVHGKWGQG